MILTTLVLASLATACTAIVLGQVGDKSDYKTTADSNGKSTLDLCALERGANTYSDDHDANACSQCIQQNCSNDVKVACNGGSDPKPWFSQLKSCAQSPWPSNYAPPSELAGDYRSYECTTYRDAESVVDDPGSATAQEHNAHNCVTTNCMQTATPPCRLCEVSVKKSANEDTRALLRDDPCGKCIVESCPGELVAVCHANQPVMGNFVEKCAYTLDPDNKAICEQMLKQDLYDASDDPNLRLSYNGDGDKALVEPFIGCVKQNCELCP